MWLRRIVREAGRAYSLASAEERKVTLPSQATAPPLAEASASNTWDIGVLREGKSQGGRGEEMRL